MSVKVSSRQLPSLAAAYTLPQPQAVLSNQGKRQRNVVLLMRVMRPAVAPSGLPPSLPCRTSMLPGALSGWNRILAILSALSRWSRVRNTVPACHVVGVGQAGVATSRYALPWLAAAFH